MFLVMFFWTLPPNASIISDTIFFAVVAFASTSSNNPLTTNTLLFRNVLCTDPFTPGTRIANFGVVAATALEEVSLPLSFFVAAADMPDFDVANNVAQREAFPFALTAFCSA